MPAALERFDRAERWLHWTTAVMVFVLIGTAAVLYVGELSALVGRREVVRRVHTWTGLFLPVPFVVAWFRSRRGRLRGDVRTLNRWDAHDLRWLRTGGHDPWARVGKFNAGQKLNAAFTGAALVVLLGTGAMLRWFSVFSDDWRTGATFVHDWTAIGLGVAVAVHVYKALRDPAALGSMLRGTVPASWARRHRPRWYEEETGLRAE